MRKNTHNSFKLTLAEPEYDIAEPKAPYAEPEDDIAEPKAPYAEPEDGIAELKVQYEPKEDINLCNDQLHHQIHQLNLHSV